MTTAPRQALSLYRRLRLLHWSLLLRLRLRWSGMRLEIDAPGGVVLSGLPALEVDPGKRRGGVLRIRLGRDVRIGKGVEIQVQTGLSNELELGDRVRVASGARFKLRGGAIRIAERTQVRDFAVLKSAGDLRIGPRSNISYGVVMHCEQAVTLTEQVSLAEGVTLVDSDHDHAGRRAGSLAPMPVVTAPVVIGRGTVIHAGATVLAGTETGQACIAGAGALLRGRYPAGSLLVGSPARIAAEAPLSEPA